MLVKKSNRLLLAVLLPLFALVFVLALASAPALAADTNVYLVWKESDFETDEDYVLTDEDGDGVFTYLFEIDAPRYLSYYIETEGEKYYPSADDAVQLAEAGAYQISFRAAFPFETLYNTKVEKIAQYYFLSTLNDFSVDDAYALTKNKNDSFEEYELLVSFTEAKTYSYYIEDILDGTQYYPNEEHLIEITEPGDYMVRFAPSNAYTPGYHTTITPHAEEVYYLMSVDSDFKKNPSYILASNEDNADYEEYIFTFTNEEERAYAYYIYASLADEKYFPNAEGYLLLDADEEYAVKFAPTHAYFTDADGTDYFTTVEYHVEPEKDYSYFLAAAINGYDPVALTRNDANGKYDEYTYAFTTDVALNYSYYIEERLEEEATHYYPNKTGVVQLAAGAYTVKFSRDFVYLSEDGVSYYTAVKPVTDEPVYYLLCRENDFEADDGYILEREEENDGFAEYVYTFDTTAQDTLFSYYIYDPVAGEKYFPNKAGVVTLEQIDSYLVRFAPGNSYLEEDGTHYNTCVDLVVDDYDGYFLLGNLNGYRYEDTTAFQDKYKLSSAGADEQEGYDYKIELDVTADMMNELETVRYFISDGETRFRGTDNKNFVITEPGLYRIYFSSPDSDGTASVYHYAVKKHASVDAVDELRVVDENDNYVYIAGANFTSDMTAKLIKRGRFLFVEIIQDGKAVNCGTVTLTYFVGQDPEQYKVTYYGADENDTAEIEAFSQFIRFSLPDGVGFLIEEKDAGLSPMMLSIIIAGSALAVLIIALVIGLFVRQHQKKKESMRDDASQKTE